MIIQDSISFLFTGSRHQLNMHKACCSQFNQDLIIMILPWYILINITDKLCQPSQKRRKLNLCCHMYPNSTGILTCFPFPNNLLRIWLGSTYPWLTYIVKEPLPFRWQRFSLCYDLTTARILVFIRSTFTHENASVLIKHLSITIRRCLQYRQLT